MRSRLALLLLLALCSAAFVRAAAPAHADPLGLMAAHQQSIFFRDTLSIDQITDLQIEFGKVFRQRAAETPGWQCMGAGAVPGAPRAVLNFDAVGPAPVLDDQTYSLAMSLDVQGLGSHAAPQIDIDWSDPGAHDAAGSDDPIEALKMVGRATIDDLLRTVKPCDLSLDLSLKGTTQITDARFAYSYTAKSGTIELDQDGKASFSVPATATVSVTGPCGGSYDFSVNGAHVEGRVEYRDGALRISELKFSHESITGTSNCPSVTCTYTDQGVAQGQCVFPNGSGPATEGPNQPFTTSFGLFSGTSVDVAADTIVTVPLADQATLSLPQPLNGASPRVTSWQGSAVVGYGAQ